MKKRPHFDKDTIEAIRARADLAEIVEDYGISLKRAGFDLMGHCPFHQENTPSFSVSPTKQMYYCFGCNAGGNAIKFVMEIGKVSFADAVRELAQRYNVPLTEAPADSDWRSRAAAIRAQQNQQRQKEEEARLAFLAASLSVEERDRAFRDLLNQLSLRTIDRQNLQERGLTDALIECGRFVSVENTTRFKGIDPRLPGVTKGHIQKLLVGGEGFLCPAWSADNKIIGAQLRLRNPKKGSKYRWLKNRQFSSHLPNGELPITVCRPSQGQKVGIGLIEGILKPWIAAQLAGWIFLGASGGRFDKSPKQLKQALAIVSSELGTRTVTLYPDAGGVSNQNVYRRDRRTVHLLQSWGYTVLIADWGQLYDKSQPDYDELLAANGHTEIKYLSASDYFALLPNPQGFGSTPKPDRLNIEEELAWKLWRQSRQFTADITINSQHFHAAVPASGTLTAIRSGLGTGKTYWLINQVLKTLENDCGFISVGYRNSLLLQFCERAQGWYHLQSELKGTSDEIFISDPYSKIACCLESLPNFDPSDFDGKIIILDEVENVVKQLLLGTHLSAYQREKNKQLFGELLNRADRIICLDGHLTDGTLNYLQQFLPKTSKKPFKIENLYAGNRGTVEFYLGSEEDSKIRQNDFSPVFAAIECNPNPFVICSDAQKKIEAFDQLLKGRGRQTLRVDSKTINRPEVKKFLKNPAEYLRERHIEILLYSPSAEAGLDIDIQDYFTDIYGLFFGVIGVDKILQIIARLRDPKATIHIYCTQKGIPLDNVPSRSPLPQQLRKEAIAYALECAYTSLKGVSSNDQALKLAQRLVKNSTDQHFEQECKLLAIENHERNHLRECLKEALLHSGYELFEVTGFKANTASLKDQQKEIDIEFAREVYSSDNITTSQANKKASNFGATSKDKAQIVKRRLLERLPGIETAITCVTQFVSPNNPEHSTDAEGASVECLQEEASVGQLHAAIASQLGEEIGRTTTTSLESGPLSLLEAHALNPSAEGEALATFGEIASPTTPNSSPVGEPAEGEALATFGEIASPTTPNSPSRGQPTEFTPPPQSEFKVEVPVFTPEFIQLVLCDRKGLIHQIEQHWLLENPEVALQLQQGRWHKKLLNFLAPNALACALKMNLVNYKSLWLKIERLLEMGIKQFLEPGRTWNKDSPEVLEFWRKGKQPKYYRAIKIKVGKSGPCEYLGRVLSGFGLGTIYDEARMAGQKIRTYQIERNALNESVRKAIFEAVGRRFAELLTSCPQTLDWSLIKAPQTQTEQVIEPVSPQKNFSNKLGEGETVTNGHSLGETLAVGHSSRADISDNSTEVKTPQIEISQAIELVSPQKNFSNKLGEGETPINGHLEAEALNDCFELNDGCCSPIEHCIALLKEAVEWGVEVIRDILSPWGGVRRWLVVLGLETTDSLAFSKLEAIAPQLYDWLSGLGLPLPDPDKSTG